MNTSKFDCEYTDFDPASDFYGRRVGAIKNPDGSVTKTPIDAEGVERGQLEHEKNQHYEQISKINERLSDIELRDPAA